MISYINAKNKNQNTHTKKNKTDTTAEIATTPLIGKSGSNDDDNANDLVLIYTIAIGGFIVLCFIIIVLFVMNSKKNSKHGLKRTDSKPDVIRIKSHTPHTTINDTSGPNSPVGTNAVQSDSEANGSRNGAASASNSDIMENLDNLTRGAPPNGNATQGSTPVTPKLTTKGLFFALSFFFVFDLILFCLICFIVYLLVCFFSFGLILFFTSLFILSAFCVFLF